MKVLITGSNGFVGRNLKSALIERGGIEIYSYDLNTDKELLREFCKSCDFVFHLAGINRTDNVEEYYSGNFGFTKKLVDCLVDCGNNSPILYTSSVHAIYDNPYGRSKKACEELLADYEIVQRIQTYVYRLPNLFGKWCRPNYNSVIATFCYNIAKGLPIYISDPGITINFAYIDDVVQEFISALNGKGFKGVDDFFTIPTVHKVRLGQIAELLYSFQKGYIPKELTSFESKLYSTFLSY